MEGAVSKPDYDALMHDLKDYFDKNAGSCPTVFAKYGGLECFCLFAQFDSGMNAVLARHTHRFRGGIAIKRITDVEMKAVANVPQEKAVDQYGNGLMIGRSRRCWPPLGYNVIIQVTREMGAGEWPPGAAPSRNRGGAGGAFPAQLTTPVRELTVQAAVPTQVLRTFPEP
jgi:hypothetical protein